MNGRLLIVTPTFAPEKIGTPHYITDLVQALGELGATVQVVTSQPYYPAFHRFEGYGRATRRQQLVGADVIRIPTIVPRGGSFAWRALSEANFLVQVILARLTGRISTSDQVVAVSPGVPFAVVAGRGLRRRGGRLIAVVHDIQSGLIRSGRLQRAAGIVERCALNRADHVTVLSPGMREALRELGVRAPISVEPLWSTVTAPADVPVDRDLVLYSGNLGRKQGTHHLLTLARHLETLAPGARVVIRGDGSERQALISAARRNCQRNVRFEDSVEVDQLAASLAGAAVHLIPQLPEGAAAAMPSKVFNILAVGRPVVAYAAPDSGLATLAEKLEAVVRVDPNDAIGFAQAVGDALTLSGEDQVRMARQAQDYIARAYSREAAARSLLRLTQRHSTDRVGSRPLRSRSGNQPTAWNRKT